jgi:hypothetical protein
VQIGIRLGVAELESKHAPPPRLPNDSRLIDDVCTAHRSSEKDIPVVYGARVRMSDYTIPTQKPTNHSRAQMSSTFVASSTAAKRI